MRAFKTCLVGLALVLGASAHAQGVDRPRNQTETIKPAPPKRPAAREDKHVTPREAVSREEALNALFDRLAKARDEDEAKGVAGLIERVLLRSGSPTADLLMNRALTAMQKKENTLAEEVLDKVVVLQPDWAEGWNRRATLRFMREDLRGAMQDIAQVLAIEPRHFGALAGMGFIFQKLDDDKRALQVFRRALAVYPHLESVRKIVDKLQVEVEGRDI